MVQSIGLALTVSNKSAEETRCDYCESGPHQKLVAVRVFRDHARAPQLVLCLRYKFDAVHLELTVSRLGIVRRDPETPQVDTRKRSEPDCSTAPSSGRVQGNCWCLPARPNAILATAYASDPVVS